tara:strand:+ start:3395 stop:3634 length:240 start_codon:yes stop_codon:yes gene_type:complete
MNNQVITSLIISLLYLIIKFIEMRFILKENKPLKQLFIDSLIVFISSIISLILLDQFKLNELIGNIKPIPNVFVNSPDF